MTLRSSFTRFASLCLSISIVALLVAPLGVLADNGYPLDDGDAPIGDALDYLRDAQDDDGSIGGFAISAWAVMAITAAGEDPGDWEGDDGDTVVEYLETEADDQIDDYEATDWARMILAIVAADEDPADFGGEDYIAGLEDCYGDDSESGLKQIGDDTLLNDDFWGVLALVAAGESVDDEIIDFILEYQNDDGGWTQDVDVDGGDDSDVDNTAAAIMALRAAGESSGSSAIQNALDFLATVQNSDGGFPQTEGDDSNAASDSWAIAALEAAGEDPDGAPWDEGDDSPVGHLLSLQEDGEWFFNYADGDDDNSVWMTSYAIPALMGIPYPVATQSSSSSSGDPEIGYVDDDIEFVATVDGDDPLDRDLVIWNEGGGTLDWAVACDEDWLSLDPSSGSSTGEDDEATMSVDIEGLDVGTHNATITITCEDADDSSVEVDVSLRILEASSDDEIIFAPDSFDFVADVDDGDPEDQILELWNGCDDPDSLDWDVESDEDWLAVSPDNGSSSGEHDAVSLSVDIGDLDPDDYEATITVSWDGGEEDIVVNLEVTGDITVEEPEIDFSPSKFSFDAVEGEDDPDDEVLTIWNSGKDVLQWTLTDDATWLTLSPRNGTSEDEDDEEEVDVMVDISDLDAGKYEAEITIKDSDASNSPETVKVTLTVEESEDGGGSGSTEGFYQLYAMTNPAMGGSITRNVLPQAAGYPAETTVTLTAVPAMGYAFTGWSGDAAGATNPITLGMTANRNVTASFLRFDAAGASNIALTYASPGMSGVTIIPYPVSSIPSSPSGFRLMSAYLVEPQGTGSFSLTFDGLADATNVGVFKVVGGVWAQVPRTVISDTSLQITLPADDPILALAYPGSTGNDIAEKIKGLFGGADSTVMIVVGIAVVLVIVVILLLFFFAGGRRDGY